MDRFLSCSYRKIKLRGLPSFRRFCPRARYSSDAQPKVVPHARLAARCVDCIAHLIYSSNQNQTFILPLRQFARSVGWKKRTKRSWEGRGGDTQRTPLHYAFFFPCPSCRGRMARKGALPLRLAACPFIGTSTLSRATCVLLICAGMMQIPGTSASSCTAARCSQPGFYDDGRRRQHAVAVYSSILVQLLVGVTGNCCIGVILRSVVHCWPGKGSKHGKGAVPYWWSMDAIIIVVCWNEGLAFKGLSFLFPTFSM